MSEYCPECEAQRLAYGFSLKIGGKYMTKVPEVKQCCAVEVEVTAVDSLKVTFKYKDKTFSKPKNEFLRTSWRKYDSF